MTATKKTQIYNNAVSSVKYLSMVHVHLHVGRKLETLILLNSQSLVACKNRHILPRAPEHVQ